MAKISDVQKRQYWRSNIKLLVVLLSIWFLVSHGFGILLADVLDQYVIPGTHMKLGFWFGQQGSIFVFLGLILIYAVVMNRMDRALLGGKEEADAAASDH